MGGYIQAFVPQKEDHILFLVVTEEDTHIFETRGEAETFLQNWNNREEEQ